MSNKTDPNSQDNKTIQTIWDNILKLEIKTLFYIVPILTIVFLSCLFVVYYLAKPGSTISIFGVIEFVKPDNKNVFITKNIYKEYEWQWAGENWYGRILLSRDDHTDSIKMARIFRIEKKYKNSTNFSFELSPSPIINKEMGESGTLKVKKNGDLFIEFLAKKQVNDEADYVSHKVVANLKQVTCFAGKVKFTDHKTNRPSEGDMILVDYNSLPGDDIEEFFEPERNFLNK